MMIFSSRILHCGRIQKFWDRTRIIKSSIHYQSLFFLLVLLGLSSFANGSPSERRGKDLRHGESWTGQHGGNFSSEETSASAPSSSSSNNVKAHSFTPSASLDDPVFSSRSHSHAHHLHDEYPPGLEPPAPEKVAKSRFDSKGIAAIDKSPPELQFGLSFTVPFISLSTDRLLNTLAGKSSYGHDPYSEVASLLKLNVGGLIVAAVVGIAAFLFVPALLPGKLPGIFPHGLGGGLVPGFLDQFMPGLGLNKPFGYGQYEHAYDPYTGDYAGSNANYNIHRNEDGHDGRARSSRRANETAVYSNIVSTVQKAVHQYWGEMETCAAHAMCLRGKLDMDEKKKRRAEELLRSQRGSRDLDDGSNGPLDEAAISSFEQVLDTIQGMKGITKGMPIFHQLHKAFKSGQSGADCSSEYKKCPVTADKISQVINNMGNYIFN